MKWRWPIVILVAAGALYAYGMFSRPGPVDAEAMRDWSLVTLEGQTVSAASTAGDVVVIEFWATWCGPCVQQVPHLKQLHARYKDRGVRLISVSLDQDADDQKQFIAEHGMDWTHANDYKQPRSLASAWGVHSIPQAFIFGPDGSLLWEGHPGNIDRPLSQAVADHAGL